VITSTAVRARTTYELAAEEGGWDAPHERTERLYHAGPSTLLEIAQGAPDEADVIALFGHEPTFSEATRMLVGGGRHRVPTAAVVGIAFEVEAWREIAFGAGELRFLLPPRLFT
jgi:phosphohistidine phosphatase